MTLFSKAIEVDHVSMDKPIQHVINRYETYKAKLVQYRIVAWSLRLKKEFTIFLG